MRIVVVDDEQNVRFAISEVLSDRGYDVVDAATGEIALSLVGDAELFVTDLRMPGMDGLSVLEAVKQKQPYTPVILLTARGSERDAVRAMRMGAHDYLVKPVDTDELIRSVERALEPRRRRIDALLAEESGIQIVGRSRALRNVVDAAVRVAPRDVPVLVTGETGTGKELIAGVLHAASDRRSGPLVRFNCAAVPADLAESELFGHARGAFTGATHAREGVFGRAHRGTLVLDEIGEFPLQLQAKLLRAVQQNEIQRVGGGETTRVDVRIVACTNRNLRAEAKSGRFREDLYFRLAVVELCVPPLRNRKEDIPDLARSFAARYADRFGLCNVSLSDDLLLQLAEQDWPGNVRELESAVARAVALSDGGTITTLYPQHAHPESVASPAGLKTRLEEYERRLLEEALAAAGGNQSEAARRLRISRTTLLEKLLRFGLR